MKRLVLIISAVIVSHLLHAQGVGINTLKPDPSAALDIVSDNKGLLIPRVDLKSLTDGKTIDKPAHSLVVFNYNPKLPGGEGYYFNAGTKDAPEWRAFATTDVKQTAFKAHSVAAQTIVTNVDTKVQFEGQDYDLGSDYAEASGTFIAPTKGIYHFDLQVKFAYSL